ncbi:GDSL esterase/lipase 5-like protein [Drosera capensis]
MARIQSTTINLATLVLISTLFLLSNNAHSVVIPDNHVALFIFGDSLYDVGMNSYFKHGTLSTYLPYGETFFGKPTGRYCNGRVLPDFVAEFANLPLLPPYLQPGLSNYTDGVNFASAGACVLVDTRPGTINLKMQVDYFEEMVTKLRSQIGVAEANKLLGNAVYLFSIGGNDYVSLVTANLNKPALSASYKREYISTVLGNLTAHITTIYNTGGRKFAFQNVGPIGCMPSTKALYTGDVGNCVKDPQTLAKTHNAVFLGIAQKLQTQLSGFKYSVFDYYSAAANRVVYNTRYGFNQSKIACCGSGAYNGAFTCGSPTVKFQACSDPSDYLWFDAAHPTEKANQQYAQLFWDGAAPNTLKALFSTTT